MASVLIADNAHPVLAERLRAAGHEVKVEPDHDYRGLLDAVQGCKALVVRSKVDIDPAFIDASPGLRCIGRLGAGMETICVDYAEAHGVHCVNSPEGNRDAVGEHAVGLLLALLDNIARADAEVRGGLWRREGNRGLELGSLTVGIIGLGSMGRAFAKRLSGFGCDVIYYDKHPVDTGVESEGLGWLRRVGLDELRREADVVSLHVPLTPDTRHMVDGQFISAMAKPFFLVNTSRGAVVDTLALADALDAGKVRGAALDVLEHENMQADALGSVPDEVRRLMLSPRTVLTPHVAGWTVESKYKLAAVLADKIIATLHDCGEE